MNRALRLRRTVRWAIWTPAVVGTLAATSALLSAWLDAPYQ